MSSVGRCDDWSWRRKPIPLKSDNIPTRPENIATDRSNLDSQHSLLVMPRLMPLVVIAERLSKTTAFAGNSGCIRRRAKVTPNMAITEITTTALARLTESELMRRLKAATPF